jgi:Phosphoesterase family
VPADIRDGQDLVLAVYQALASSAHWERTLLIVLYDEHGGFFDHVAPPEAPDDDPETFGRYGVRVPALIVSPYIEPGSVSHTLFDHTSIIKTILLCFCPDALRQPTRREALPALSRPGAPRYMGVRVAQANALGGLLPLPRLDRCRLNRRSSIGLRNGPQQERSAARPTRTSSSAHRRPTSRCTSPPRLASSEDSGIRRAGRRSSQASCSSNLRSVQSSPAISESVRLRAGPSFLLPADEPPKRQRARSWAGDDNGALDTPVEVWICLLGQVLRSQRREGPACVLDQALAWFTNRHSDVGFPVALRPGSSIQRAAASKVSVGVLLNAIAASAAWQRTRLTTCSNNWT